MADDRRAASDADTVAAGYDALADEFGSWAARVVDPLRDRLFADLIESLPPGGRVLDVGCGAGVPWTARLAARFEVTGVDISVRQVEAARRNVPGATFVAADITTTAFADGSFDGIVALYSLGHLPLAEHAPLLGRFSRWLRPGGLLLASVPAQPSAGWTGEWLGVRMFFASPGADACRAALRGQGWTVISDEVGMAEEPEGPAAFLWILARSAAGDQAP